MACRSRRGWPRPNPAPTGCSSRSRPARSRSASTATIPAAIVATALFGDGAAAAVVTSGEHSLARITGIGGEAVARYASDHGLGRRGPRASRSSSTAPSRPSSRRSWPQAVDEMCAEHGYQARRHRPLLLPPRRGEGDRRDRKRARAQPGRAQPRARGAARLWQHERADGAVRARSPARTRAFPTG